MSDTFIMVGLSNKIKKYKQIVQFLLDKKELSEEQKDFLEKEKVLE